jgi:hypothetical protein
MTDQKCCGECTPEKMSAFMKKVKPIFEESFPECAAKMKECCGDDFCNTEGMKKMMKSMQGCPCMHMMKGMCEDKSECDENEGEGGSCCV